MSHKVFLDVEDRVLTSLGADSWTLADVIAKGVTTATQEIEDAPEGLKLYIPDAALLTSDNLNYHQKTSGAGTSISDYTLIDDLRMPKIIAQDAIDTNTRYLIGGPNGLGFIHDDHYFSMSSWNQINLLGLYSATAVLTFPVGWSARTLEGVYVEYSLVDIAAANSLFLAGLSRKKAIMSDGNTLKTQIEDATTQAEIDAVTDDRTFSDYP